MSIPISTGQSEDIRTGAGPTRFSEDGQRIEFRPPLPRQWADLYQTWNMAFISKYPDFPFFMAKLLIPSVSGYQGRPENYLYPRDLIQETHQYNLRLPTLR